MAETWGGEAHPKEERTLARACISAGADAGEDRIRSVSAVVDALRRSMITFCSGSFSNGLEWLPRSDWTGWNCSVVTFGALRLAARGHDRPDDGATPVLSAADQSQGPRNGECDALPTCDVDSNSIRHSWNVRAAPMPAGTGHADLRVHQDVDVFEDPGVASLVAGKAAADPG